MYLPKHQFTQVSITDLIAGGVPELLSTAAGALFNKPEITLTSEGELDDVPPEDLEKGIFTNATQYFLPEQYSTEDVPNAFVEPTDQDKKNCKFER